MILAPIHTKFELVIYILIDNHIFVKHKIKKIQFFLILNNKLVKEHKKCHLLVILYPFRKDKIKYSTKKRKRKNLSNLIYLYFYP